MYLCAKLVGIVTMVLSAGTVSPLVVPYLKSTNSWLFKQGASDHQYNFQELDNTVKKRLEKLTHQFTRFSSAASTAKWLKEQELAKIKPLFDKIFETEESINNLFKKISADLNNLAQKHIQLFENSNNKLNAEKQKKLSEVLKAKYSELKETLTKWEESLNQIVCDIEQKENNCDRKGVAGEVSWFFQSINSLFSSLLSLGSKEEAGTQSSGGGGQSGPTSEKVGSAKALEGLEEVKKTLLKNIEDFQKQSAGYSAGFTYSTSKEKVATMLLIVFSGTIKSLQEQIKILQEAIEKDGKSSNKQIQQVDQLQDQLTISYKDYSNLKQLESVFQWWKNMFEERIIKNEDEKAREEDIARRKHRK